VCPSRPDRLDDNSLLDAGASTRLQSQSRTDRRCRPAHLEGEITLFTNTKRLSLKMNRRPLVNEFTFELARYQRTIQHL
jgi:hypothetical protein